MTKMLKFIKADWFHQSWGTNIEFLLIMLCALVLVPIIYNLVTYLLAKINRVQMAKTFGNNSQVVIGGIGNIVHELELFLFAKMGGHNTRSETFYSWKNFRKFQNTTSVEHNWVSHSMYQSFCDYLIGFAPVYVTSLLLWGVQTLLGGNYYKYPIHVNGDTLMQSFFNGLNTAFSGGNILESIIYFVVVLIVASTAFSISRGAIERGLTGLMPWIVFIVVVWLILVFSTVMMASMPVFWGIITWSLFLLGHLVIYLVVIFILVCIFTGLNKL